MVYIEICTPIFMSKYFDLLWIKFCFVWVKFGKILDKVSNITKIFMIRYFRYHLKNVQDCQVSSTKVLTSSSFVLQM